MLCTPVWIMQSSVLFFFWIVIPALGQVQTQVEEIDEKHNISGKIAGAAMTAQAKVHEVDTK